MQEPAFWVDAEQITEGAQPVITKRTRRLAFAALFICMAFWGVSFVAIKIALTDGVPPMVLNTLRFAITALLLMALLKIKEPHTRITRQTLPLMFAAGFFGITVYFLSQSIALETISSSNASLISGCAPVLTLLAEIIIFKKRANWGQIAGIAVSVAGVFVLVAASGGEFAGTFSGNMIMLAGCASWVVYTFLASKAAQFYSPLAVTAYQCLFGLVCFIPLSVPGFMNMPPPTIRGIVAIIALALTSSFASYLCYNWAVRILGGLLASTFINFVPLITMICGVLVLHENVYPLQLAGGAMVLASIFILNSSQKKRNTHNN